MPKPYDASTKYLVDQYPADWLALAGLNRHGSIDLIDANLSTVTAEADKIIRINEPDPWLVHIELQASRDPRLGCRLFRYNGLIDERHNLPVQSVVFLLRPEADSADLTGEYRRSRPAGVEYLWFRYQVVRIWQEPVEAILNGGLGILPLAPVANLGTMPIEAVIQEMEARIDRVPYPLAGLLWLCSSILMGLDRSAAEIGHLLRGVHTMKESSIYQAILAEGHDKGLAEGRDKGLAEGLAQGELRALKRLLIRQGERRLGSISPEDRARVEAISEIKQVEALDDRVPEVSTWAELWS